MANLTTSGRILDTCVECPSTGNPSNSPSPSDNQAGNWSTRGPVNNSLPLGRRRFAEATLILQRGDATWTGSPCGRFESDTGVPSLVPNADSVYTTTTKENICSGPECEDDEGIPTGKFPTFKDQRSYAFVSDSTFGVVCEETLTSIQSCSDGQNCQEPDDPNYPLYTFSGSQSSTSQWNAIDAARPKSYSFDNFVSTGLNPYKLDGIWTQWVLSKKFLGFGLRGAAPKVAVRCANLIIGFNYIFGYETFKKDSPSDAWTSTGKVRIPFVATANEKDFGAYLENFGTDDETNYNNMGSISLPSGEGQRAVGNFGIIYDLNGLNNCSEWR